MPEPKLIASANALVSFVSEARAAPWLGIDTEFVRDRTYYPFAGLIQIATPRVTALIDPVQLPSLDPLAALLFDSASTKILHAARQDLELFVLLFDRVPTPLFDTQMAAALLELAPQIGYAALAEELLGVPPGLALGRYNWLKRPLSVEAVQYAAEDVTHLCALRDMLERQLHEKNLYTEFARQMETLAEANRYRPDPANAWKHCRAARRLSGNTLAGFQRLAAWREQIAMQKNLPRQWVIRDAALVAIAKESPGNATELARIEQLDAGAQRRYGAALLHALATPEKN